MFRPSILVALCLSACGSTGSLSVAKIEPNLEAWNGRKIVASGWISGCRHTFDCYLVAGPRGRERHDHLILDYVKELEDELGAADGHKVLLEAQVTNLCIVNICTDRAPALIPIRLIKVY